MTSLGIGIVIYGLSGIFCESEAAALDYATFGDMHGCEVFEVGVPLMPQAVVAKTNKHKIIRMGTITDPVQNVWMVVPRDQKVTGEPVE
jgi:hypothetical protein